MWRHSETVNGLYTSRKKNQRAPQVRLQRPASFVEKWNDTQIHAAADDADGELNNQRGRRSKISEWQYHFRSNLITACRNSSYIP
jgi:hypothetical protein